MKALEELLLDAYLGEDPQHRPVVVTDGRTRLVSAEAARTVSDDTLALLERHAAGLVHDDTPGAPGADRLGARLRPVLHSGRVIGVTAVFSGAGGAAPHDHADPPMLPGLAGSSLPWRSALTRLAALAAAPGPLMVTGEPGAGKAAVARGLYAEAPAFDAAEATADDARRWCRDLDADPGDRGPVLLRHLEVLDATVAAALHSVLERRPSLRLVATYTPGDPPPGACLERLVGHFSARSVTLPPLRERPEDIPALLRALRPRPDLGRPPLTWTVEARHALERYPWPGNVAELALLVRGIADGRRLAGPVRPEELPDAVRDGGGGRRLSSLERAERAAILEALRTHGGNKLRTAQALGIARATVYRKLRSYGI
ncbi:helix-turn-helix domain-containing protein [Streptomyces sp. NPDC059373]